MQKGPVAVCAYFVLRAGEPSQPFAVLAHLGPDRTFGTHRIEGPSQLGGQFHLRRIIEQAKRNGKSFFVTMAGPLLKQESRHFDRRKDVVPLGGDVLVGNLHVALLPRHERRGGRQE